MGDKNHAIEMIEAFSSITENFKGFTFAFKLQFRNLDRLYASKLIRIEMTLHYVKRFQDTGLTLMIFKKV